MSTVEVTLVSFLLAVVVVPTLAFLFSNQRSNNVVDEAARQQADARLALEVFSRSIREGGYPQGYSYVQSSIFVSAANNDVTFYSDVDSDGITEQVRYWLDTTEAKVMRTVREPDCTISPCSYNAGTLSTAMPVVSSVRNSALSACGRTGTQALFSYWKSDRGTGLLTQIGTPTTNINDLIDVNHVKMTVVTDITPGKAPTCVTLETSVSLRNWRG